MKIDDIINKKEHEDKEKLKKEVRQDVNDLFEGIYSDIEDTFKRKKIEKELKEKRTTHPIIRLIKFFGGILITLGVCILTVNFFIGNIVLLRWLLQTLF
jgi:hypothetical protein